MKRRYKYLNRFPVIIFTMFICAVLFINMEIPAEGETKSKSDGKDEKSTEELFFTFAGVTLGGGIDMIQYKDWMSDSEGQGTKKISGNYFCGGAQLDIFVNFIIGEFSVQYMKNMNGEVPVWHMIYDAAGKYAYQLYNYLSLTAGAGLFFESQPGTGSYDRGAGLGATIGAVYNIDRDWKLLFDITGRFGSFGLGEESTRQSYGAKIGIVYKVGRI